MRPPPFAHSAPRGTRPTFGRSERADRRPAPHLPDQLAVRADYPPSCTVDRVTHPVRTCRRNTTSGRRPTSASTPNAGTMPAATTVEPGSAWEPNHWSAATLMLSITHITNTPPATVNPQGLRFHSQPAPTA